MAVAIVTLLGLIVIAAFAVVGAGDSDDGEGGRQVADVDPSVELPEQKFGDLKAAAEAAGCDVENPAVEEATHDPKAFKASDYRTNPPTSGRHNPTWYEDGIYEAGGVPELGKLVHTLEHGRINVQYRPGTSASTVAQLEALLAEQDSGYHMLLYENTTSMPYAVSATAWGRMLGCKKMSDEALDALRTFRTAYIDQGPEAVP